MSEWNNEVLGAVLLLMLLALILWALTMPMAWGATICHERANVPQGVVWWRYVDGKRCWYAGHRMMDRSRLQWPRLEPQPEEPERPPPPKPYTEDGFMDRWPAPVEFLPIDLWRDDQPIRTWRGL